MGQMLERPAPWPTREPAHQDTVSSRLLLPLVVLAIGTLVLWRSGVGKVPHLIDFERFARLWPHSELLPLQGYIARQALGQALYSALDWAGTGHFLWLHVAALAASATALSWWLLRRLGSQRGVIAICLLALSPVTTVLMTWVGMYDAFSVLVWVALVMSLRRNSLAQGLVAVLGGLQNFEQFAVSVVLLALLPSASRSLGLRVRPAALAIGALLGKGALEVYLHSAGAVDGSRLGFLADDSMRAGILTSFAVTAPLVLWSALGGLWVPVLRHLPATWSAAGTGQRWRLAVVAAVVLAVGVLWADHTRVMALGSFPLVVLLCMHLAGREDDVRSWLRTPDTWLIVAAPSVVIWQSDLLPVGLQLSAWGR
jgi:hypothetical protein